MITRTEHNITYTLLDFCTGINTNSWQALLNSDADQQSLQGFSAKGKSKRGLLHRDLDLAEMVSHGRSRACCCWRCPCWWCLSKKRQSERIDSSSLLSDFLWRWTCSPPLSLLSFPSLCLPSQSHLFSALASSSYHARASRGDAGSRWDSFTYPPYSLLFLCKHVLH